ncbi:MAG: Holliday junction branch migration protein RuvA [Vulcanimicrobiaceae bacterium]
MFSRIVGTLVERTSEAVLLDVGGLGYEILLPPCVAQKIVHAVGERVTLEIYAVVNLDGQTGRFTYYGFTNAVEREFFEALLRVASIGPRSAARAFSAPMAQIAQAIDRADMSFLKTLPGIGQQKARDIVAKLQGKVARFLLIREAEAAGVSARMPDFADEALAVLLQLEYKRGEAEAMIRETLEAVAVVDAEELLAEIYRRKSAGAGGATANGA